MWIDCFCLSFTYFGSSQKYICLQWKADFSGKKRHENICQKIVLNLKVNNKTACKVYSGKYCSWKKGVGHMDTAFTSKEKIVTNVKGGTRQALIK